MLTFCFQFPIQIQHTFPGGTSAPPPPLLCLSFSLSLFLLWPTSFTPSHLSISSHLALKSPFQFQNALKPTPARRSLVLPRDKTGTIYLSSPLHTLRRKRATGGFVLEPFQVSNLSWKICSQWFQMKPSGILSVCAL